MARKKYYYEIKLSEVIKEAGGEKFLKENCKYAEDVINLLCDAHEKIVQAKSDYLEIGILDYQLHDWAYARFNSITFITPKRVVEDYGVEKLKQDSNNDYNKAEKLIMAHKKVYSKKILKQYPGFETSSDNFEYELYTILVNELGYIYPEEAAQ
jgi:hypothetical protein